jgi:nanoRNase/pAp phosphatase (c-di-AMP/oligoRNAs hydrolase)
MHDIFSMLQSLSVEERKLYQALLDHAHYSGRIGYLALDLEESRNYLNRVEYSLFVKVIKSVTDFLSEKSGKIGMTVYYDTPEVSNLIQFRIRVARDITDIDLRSILESFNIKDGGGHPGAIGFRVPAEEMTDFPAYIKNLLFSLKTF